MLIYEIKNLYESISILYGKEPLGNEEIKLLAEVFKPYTEKEIQGALQEHLRNKAFAPKPADLIKTAEKNRREYAKNREAEERKNIKFDSNGRQIYKCPFCKDSGYMLVDDDPLYSPCAIKCICTHPIKSLEYAENGRVKLRLKSRHRRTEGYYHFDKMRGMFVGEDVPLKAELSLEVPTPDDACKLFELEFLK